VEAAGGASGGALAASGEAAAAIAAGAVAMYINIERGMRMPRRRRRPGGAEVWTKRMDGLNDRFLDDAHPAPERPGRSAASVLIKSARG
jgi:hypothetical protein